MGQVFGIYKISSSGPKLLGTTKSQEDATETCEALQKACTESYVAYANIEIDEEAMQ